MKAGDKVWAMTTVVSIEPNGVIYGDWDMHDPACVIPDHPALPAVARWLAEHGDALTCLEFIAGVATSAITSRCIQARARGEVTPTGEEARAQDVMDALLAALTTEETA